MSEEPTRSTNDEGERFAHKNWKVDRDGYASLPEGPGLGVEIDEKALAKTAADPRVKFV